MPPGHFCISGDRASVAEGLIERHQATATRVVSYFAGMAWARDERALGPWGELAAAVQHPGIADRATP